MTWVWLRLQQPLLHLRLDLVRARLLQARVRGVWSQALPTCFPRFDGFKKNNSDLNDMDDNSYHPAMRCFKGLSNYTRTHTIGL